MAKRKAESLTSDATAVGSKKIKHSDATKITKPVLMDDSDSENGSDDDSGGVKLVQPGFTINEEYAKRFEHNKKREELQRCLFTAFFCFASQKLTDTSGGEIQQVY